MPSVRVASCAAAERNSVVVVADVLTDGPLYGRRIGLASIMRALDGGIGGLELRRGGDGGDLDRWVDGFGNWVVVGRLRGRCKSYGGVFNTNILHVF